MTAIKDYKLKQHQRGGLMHKITRLKCHLNYQKYNPTVILGYNFRKIS